MPDTKNKVYEVLVETWGNQDLYHKGDIIHAEDIADGHDLVWAEKQGAVRALSDDEVKGHAKPADKAPEDKPVAGAEHEPEPGSVHPTAARPGRA